MDDKSFIEIKKESQDDETVINETNNSDLTSSVNEKVVVKNEPLGEQAGCDCSSLKITNYFSVSNVSMNSADLNGYSIPRPSTLNDSNDSIAFLPNDVVKTEKRDTSTEPNGRSITGINLNLSEVKKKEPDDYSMCNSSSTSLQLNNVIKEENTINNVKEEYENSPNVQSDSNSTSAFPGNFSANQSSTIANILTASIPSTSGTCSPTTNDQTDDVSLCTDQKPVCRYGKSCYRLNLLHRQNFYHPPGSDPLKSPEKPRCKYGSRCYRKNEEHRKHFIHDGSPYNATSTKRKRKVRNAVSQQIGHLYESDSDLSLYDDSYDCSSDEFHPGDDDDDTDFDADLDAELLNND